jgi:UTP-glucose-1-phosphate uridylyltransferase
MTRELVGDEPFAVLLADDMVDAQIPCAQAVAAEFAVSDKYVTWYEALLQCLVDSENGTNPIFDLDNYSHNHCNP